MSSRDTPTILAFEVEADLVECAEKASVSIPAWRINHLAGFIGLCGFRTEINSGFLPPGELADRLICLQCLHRAESRVLRECRVYGLQWWTTSSCFRESWDSEPHPILQMSSIREIQGCQIGAYICIGQGHEHG